MQYDVVISVLRGVENSRLGLARGGSRRLGLGDVRKQMQQAARDRVHGSRVWVYDCRIQEGLIGDVKVSKTNLPR